ncbi:hypothetical protein EMPS_05082 [Entomortierella parvispora]|uniref:Uncharacterized protein n=1 Tax=Entomortierella parvispora TaxID=205924 RepID=A0A9P3H9T2_9FUNG|nr:hypothetical protein EMPS_05082 [Entomortierella parvispora]
MTASTIATVAARSVRAPFQAAARRQMSTASSNASTGSTQAAAGQHSTQRLAIASGVSAVVGVDVTYAYFTYFKKADK